MMPVIPRNLSFPLSIGFLIGAESSTAGAVLVLLACFTCKNGWPVAPKHPTLPMSCLSRDLARWGTARSLARQDEIASAMSRT